ncbi:MAG: hypothetical protein IPI66_15600 [Chitinophagaceae bacterium]|nr:hypothetical protein [Chitinophagaceae bacterium]
MKRTIAPSSLCGTIQAPASKSAMQRACALAFLHEGETRIYNPGRSQDDRAALGIIRSLGAEVKEEEGRILIFPGLKAGATQKAWATQKDGEIQKEGTTNLVRGTCDRLWRKRTLFPDVRPDRRIVATAGSDYRIRQSAEPADGFF